MSLQTYHDDVPRHLTGARRLPRDAEPHGMRLDRVANAPSQDVMTAPVPDASRVAAGKLLVRVHAAARSPGSERAEAQGSVTDSLPSTLLPCGLSGTVEGMADNVRGFAIGDEVFGVADGPGQERVRAVVAVDAGRMARKPRRLGFLEAAMLPVIGVSAWQMLFRIGRLDPGETVVILGADSPVGAFAVQLAAACGVRSVALSKPEEAAALRALGANHVIDAGPGRLEVHCRRAAVVVDTMGGAVQRRAAATLRSGSTLVSCIEPPDFPFLARRGVSSRFFVADVTTHCLSQVARMIDTGLAITDSDNGLARTWLHRLTGLYVPTAAPIELGSARRACES